LEAFAHKCLHYFLALASLRISRRRLGLRALFETAYTFGFRLGELRSMRCRQINFVSGTITLETSKNGEPREAFMTAAVRELLAALVAGKKPEDFVFAKPLKKGRKNKSVVN
jgi:integrase